MVLRLRIVLLMLINSSIIFAHDNPTGGLFYALDASEKLIRKTNPLVNLERKADGSCSPVVCINGVLAFNRYVILASTKRPVVVKICDKSEESLKVQESCQQAADALLGKVSFISCNILDQINDFPENYHVVSKILAQEKVEKPQLPLFLFYKNGALYRPHHSPPVMIHGFYTKDNLEAFINQKFFPQEHDVVQQRGVVTTSSQVINDAIGSTDKPLYDIVATTTH